MKDRPDALEATLGAAALALFIAYFGVHAFRHSRVVDHLRHVASVASLYRDFVHPPTRRCRCRERTPKSS